MSQFKISKINQTHIYQMTLNIFYGIFELCHKILHYFSSIFFLLFIFSNYVFFLQIICKKVFRGMAKMTYTISCSCGKSISGTNSSGDPDQYLSEFVCAHFRCTRGMWLGANSHATVTVDYKCSRNCHSNSWWHKWWGWCLAGDPITSKITCNGHTLTFWSHRA